jgi:hypothetical protein
VLPRSTPSALYPPLSTSIHVIHVIHDLRKRFSVVAEHAALTSCNFILEAVGGEWQTNFLADAILASDKTIACSR